MKHGSVTVHLSLLHYLQIMKKQSYQNLQKYCAKLAQNCNVTEL